MRGSLVGLSLLFLVIYHANGKPLWEIDCVPAPYAAWSLARHGSLDLRRYPNLRRYRGSCIRETPDGSLVSRYPVGSTLAMLPFVAPLAAFREAPLSEAGMRVLGKLAAACYVAAAAALFFLTCRELAPSARWPATILFGLGTCLCSVASQAIWMHGPATFWVCLALWFLMRPDGLTGPRSWAAGLALGLAVLTRPTTAFFALATGATLLAHRRWRLAAALVVAGVAPVFLLCAMNWWQFGSPLLGGYAAEYDNEPPPLWLGLTGLLVAPSRGVLVYSPALLLVPFGVVALCRRKGEYQGQRRHMLLAWLLAAGVTVLYYARWHDWKGGWCYGPRFLCETMPVLCLAFAIGYSQLGASWQRLVATGLVALSVAVHLVGIFGYSGYVAWQRRHNLSDHGRCLFDLEDTQIEAHTRALLREVLAIVLVSTGNPASVQGQDVAHNFRGGKLDEDVFRYHGAGAENFVSSEAGGLRIHYTGVNAPLNPVGIDRPAPVRGDFVLTVRYEVLKAEPNKGDGVGPEIYLILDSPERDGIALDQRLRPAGGRVISYNHLTTNEQGRRTGKAYKAAPTTEASDSGRLRLARQGPTLISSWSEGKEEEFRELTRDDLGAMGICLIRLGGTSGRDPTAILDMRFLEFHLRESEPAVAAKNDDDAPAPGAQPRIRWNLIAVLAFFFVVVTAALVLLFIKFRMGKPVAEKKAPETKAGSGTFLFPCSSCGKNLRVNNALAGKRVKCPRCQEEVPVPTCGAGNTSLKPSR